MTELLLLAAEMPAAIALLWYHRLTSSSHPTASTRTSLHHCVPGAALYLSESCAHPQTSQHRCHWQQHRHHPELATVLPIKGDDRKDVGHRDHAGLPHDTLLQPAVSARSVEPRLLTVLVIVC